MSLPSITILITTHNYGRFIEECIDSALAQEYPADKADIVVVDDGSTDDTPERVKKYGDKIRYFRKPNGGQASALNLGFAHARGEIISLLDADDYFFPQKLARVGEAFAKDPELGMFYHPFLEFDMETSERRVSKFPPLISGSASSDPEKFIGWGGPGTCVSFRREFLNRLLPIPEEIRMIADDYVGSLIIFIARISSTNECLAAYRLHGSNSYYAQSQEMSPALRTKRHELFRIVHCAMRRWLAENGYTRSHLGVRVFVDSWDINLEADEFKLKPPGRLRFFWWLLRKNRMEGLTQSWQFTLLKYLTAPAAFVFGYSNSGEMNAWFDKTDKAAGQIYRSILRREPKRNLER